MKNTLVKLVFIGVLLSVAYVLNRYDLLEKTLEWIEGYGVWGPAIFLLVYVLSAVFFVPSFIFTFSSGILFGLWKGFGLSVAGTAFGALVAFLIGRYFAHDFVEKRIASNAEFQKLATALKQKGWKVILLARFSPVFPFLIGNYAFGVTGIRARHYFAATFFGTMPSALAYSYLGFVTGDFALLGQDGRTRTPGEWALLGFGLVMTFVLAWYLRRLAEKSSAS